MSVDLGNLLQLHRQSMPRMWAVLAVYWTLVMNFYKSLPYPVGLEYWSLTWRRGLSKRDAAAMKNEKARKNN